ncbi:hypothetical protein MNBD_GAMMA16-2343 [hydrothermal vent metagenome]|uniref:DUF4340 domain-containing protein n=1 Tax=hydrothermal vent metagenome TaxID=652676 RepID=A0A3B0YS90_9ZZZZ
MKKTIRILGVIFIAQLIIVTALLLPTEDSVGSINKQNLLTFSPNQVNKIIISGGDKALILESENTEWNLPEYYGFPVAKNRVPEFIQKLSDFKQGWPVATTKAAAKRFKVSDDDFERKIELYQGESLLDTLYVGSSPGFRKVHVRKANTNNIYDVSFSAFDASIKTADWRDSSLLRLEQTAIIKISSPDFSLIKEGDLFVLDGVDESLPIVQSTVARYVQKVIALNTVTVLGTETRIAFNQADPLLLLTVESKTEKWEYRLSRSSEGEYVLKRSDLPFYFVLHDEVAKPLIVNDKKHFLLQPESESDT